LSPGLPWHWPEMAARVSSIWDTPWIHALEARFDLATVTAPMCMFGSRFRKYFTLLIPRYMLPTFSWLVGLFCPQCGTHVTHEPAWGVDALGRSRAALAGRYPLDLHYLIFGGHVSHGPQGVLSCVPTVGQSASLSLYPSDSESDSVDDYMPVSDIVRPPDPSQTPFGSVSFGHRLSPLPSVRPSVLPPPSPLASHPIGTGTVLATLSCRLHPSPPFVTWHLGSLRRQAHAHPRIPLDCSGMAFLTGNH
jgi:hypothetical protein